MTTVIKADGSGLTLEEVGFDSQGRETWRFPESGIGLYRKVDPPTVTVTPQGLVIVDLIVPADPAARVSEPGENFTIHYSGWTPNGFMFDSSRQEGRSPYTTTIPGRLVQGWNLGVPGMKVGATRRLLIPSELGYGARGQPQAGIPADSWLVFDVELLSAQPAAPTPPAQP
ncbi:MAG: FKBP-type peptidyl-prolyl cis-trans isomerase [Phycisphaerales bacterium]|nr:FKBP-type peptidyl-prolyl cis-trans isomerase [Phycisphaerales bacterium]